MNNKVDGAMRFKQVTDDVRALFGSKDVGSVETKSPPFRKDTKLPSFRIGFYFAGAGMGDYICYMPAIKWVAKNCPWIKGTIYCRSYFTEIASNMMLDFKDWKVLPIEDINLTAHECDALYGPGIESGSGRNRQLVNGTGAHLVDVGFMYFANMAPPPADATTYPQLNFAYYMGKTLEQFDSRLEHNKYVVITPGGVSENRTVPGHYWNPILDYILHLGLVPVFLGKSQITERVVAKFPDGCKYELGLDLRDKTSPMEAAWIMKHALCVLGLDNGLIHVAACTDATIIAGFGSVHPDQRRPKRPTYPDYNTKKRWHEITLTSQELECIHCQTNMKCMIAHNFKKCLYGDNKCIDLIFANEGKLWKDKIYDTLPYDHPECIPF